MNKKQEKVNFIERHYQFLYWSLAILVVASILPMIKIEGIEYVILSLVFIYAAGMMIINEFSGL